MLDNTRFRTAVISTLVLTALLPVAILLVMLEGQHQLGGTFVWHRFHGQAVVAGLLASLLAALSAIFTGGLILLRRSWRPMMLIATGVLGISIGLPLCFIVLTRVFDTNYARYAQSIMASTDWAPGFNQGRFESIVIGTPREAVIQQLGLPLRAVMLTDSRELLTYSDPGPEYSLAQAYHQRWVILRQGRVLRVLNRLVTPETGALRGVEDSRSARIAP